MNKDEYLGWRHQNVTREYLKAVMEQMDAMLAQLVNNAGDDPKKDMYRRGAIEALRFLAEWQPEFEIDEGEEDDAESVRPQGSY